MVIRLSLSMAIPSDFNRSELHGVVFGAESSGRQQEPQNLRISLCGPASHEVEQQKHQQPAIKLLSRLKVAAPRHMAKKKSFRSGPRIVSGRDNDRCTLLIRLASAMCFSSQDVGVSAAGKKPRWRSTVQMWHLQWRFPT